MGTGWRRARNALGLTVCTSIPRDDLDALDSSVASPRTPVADNSPRFLGDGSPSPSPRLENVCPSPSLIHGPRLQCRTSSSPRLRSQSVANSPRVLSGSSPRICSQSQCSPRLQCRTNASPRLRNIENVPLTEGSVPSSPRSPSRLSRLRSSIRLSRSTCAMCLQTMKPGHGHAIFTAECSHAFHFPCIASNVKHGNLVCPVCRAKWKEVPSQVSVKQEKAERVLTPRSSSSRNASHAISDDYRRLDRRSEESSFTPRGTRQIAPSEPLYDDDEPLDPNPRTNGTTFTTIHEEEEEFEFKGFVVEPQEEAAATTRNGSSKTGFVNGVPSRNVEVAIEPEVEVLPAGKSCESFTVLLQVKAPPATGRQQKNVKQNSPSLILDPKCRAPIDLVTVLDVSGSMSGTKLQLLKRAMRLVISSLSPADRLSVVAFSSTAKRAFPLRRMVPQGQRAVRRVIDRLACSEGTNIADGLKKAAKILEDRRERNPVASIMLLSDGQDKHSFGTLPNRPSLPASIRQSTRYGHFEIPVHAFGFGSDHDAAKMHAISEGSGGTFSFVQAEDAFAQCIGGLLSVVVQDVQLTVTCCSTPGVQVHNIYAGSHQTRVLDDYGTVKLGDLYAEEDRDIIVELKIPAVRYPNPMNVLSVSCSFKDPVTQQVTYGKEQFLTIRRPESIRGYPVSVSLKVENHKLKLRTAKAIGDARILVDRGDAKGAQQRLYQAKALLQCSDASQTINELRRDLEMEIGQIQARMRYERERLAETSRDRQRARRTAGSEPTTPTTPSVLDIIMRYQTDSNGEPLTPTSAWRAAERLAKVAMMRKSLNRVSDLHGFENARF
uniref:TSA: Wollemia nobilis Ref_Wollemi_Transcript_2391_3432 transcribed RNA sequence n=1 Tax=Wollemia nobilis TaxID=56998 RepID=A0A0C9S905_9CONI